MKFSKNKIFIYFIILLFYYFIILPANFCLAQGASDTILPGAGSGKCDCGAENKTEACKQYCGDYGLNDFVNVGVIASQWILGIVGSLALLMFVYGGFMFIISSGSSEKVTQAKEIIVGAVIGLVIVFTSYMIIQFTMEALGVKVEKGGWAVTSWFK